MDDLIYLALDMTWQIAFGQMEFVYYAIDEALSSC